MKLVDFGLSEFVSGNSSTMPGDGGLYGTIGYMAPEVFLKRTLGIDAFKADVFSFAMMCSEIFTTKKHYNMFRDYKASILKGERPKLPKTCSSDLKSLIHECWSSDPSKRPTFLNICQRLTKLKSEAIVKEFTSHVDFNTNQWQWWTTLKFWKFITSLPSNREVSNTIKSNPMSCEVSNVFFKSIFLPQNYFV